MSKDNNKGIFSDISNAVNESVKAMNDEIKQTSKTIEKSYQEHKDKSQVPAETYKESNYEKDKNKLGEKPLTELEK